MKEEWRHDVEVLKAWVAKATKNDRLRAKKEYCASALEILAAYKIIMMSYKTALFFRLHAVKIAKT